MFYANTVICLFSLICHFYPGAKNLDVAQWYKAQSIYSNKLMLLMMK